MQAQVNRRRPLLTWIPQVGLVVISLVATPLPAQVFDQAPTEARLLDDLQEATTLDAQGRERLIRVLGSPFPQVRRQGLGILERKRRQFSSDECVQAMRRALIGNSTVVEMWRAYDLLATVGHFDLTAAQSTLFGSGSMEGRIAAAAAIIGQLEKFADGWATDESTIADNLELSAFLGLFDASTTWERSCGLIVAARIIRSDYYRKGEVPLVLDPATRDRLLELTVTGPPRLRVLGLAVLAYTEEGAFLSLAADLMMRGDIHEQIDSCRLLSVRLMHIGLPRYPDLPGLWKALGAIERAALANGVALQAWLVCANHLSPPRTITEPVILQALRTSRPDIRSMALLHVGRAPGKYAGRIVARMESMVRACSKEEYPVISQALLRQGSLVPLESEFATHPDHLRGLAETSISAGPLERLDSHVLETRLLGFCESGHATLAAALGVLHSRMLLHGDAVPDGSTLTSLLRGLEKSRETATDRTAACRLRLAVDVLARVGDKTEWIQLARELLDRGCFGPFECSVLRAAVARYAPDARQAVDRILWSEWQSIRDAYGSDAVTWWLVR